MARKKKYPKSPKASASTEVWDRYKKKVAEIAQHNKAVDAAKKKKQNLIDSVRKLKQY